ncbi:BamA/TamA family outer membrane protein [Faucicola atlantae]|uniref:BamA/TamA family outer membrane protein n=1 Tax=Faucicola atlantae TaxID=34059 RepID=UPI00338DBDC1
MGSFEYNYQFRDGLRAAVFTDFGNAYDIKGDENNSTKVSVGTGIRWASPIGTVRLDVAHGLTSDNDGFKVHFFIGSPL